MIPVDTRHVLEATPDKQWNTSSIPLTYADSPRCDDPTGHAEDKQDSARADGHQSLHDKTSVEADLIEGPDAARRGVREQLAVEQHDPADQVQAQEHGHRENDVHVGVSHGRRVAEGQASSPGEHILTRDWMDGADKKLERNKENPLKIHGYPPVICTVVHHEELKGLKCLQISQKTEAISIKKKACCLNLL